jgi:fatty acid desaturase
LTDRGGTKVRNRQRQLSNHSLFAKLLTILAACFATVGLSGCLGAGYSSGGGWFVWPGSLGLLVIVLLIVFLVRRR